MEISPIQATRHSISYLININFIFASKEKLEIVNALGFVFHFDFAQCRHFARPPIPSRALRGEDRILFELFQEYTADNIFYRETAPIEACCETEMLGKLIKNNLAIARLFF